MPFLPEAVADLLAQDAIELEVLAVDDGSSDGSRAVLEAATRSDPRFRLLRAEGQGAAAALNQALGAAQGEYIGQMEADDRAPPCRFQRLARALREHPNWAGAVSQVRLLGAVRPGMQRYIDWQNRLLQPAELTRARFIEIPALHQTGLYHRRLFEQVGPFREGVWPLDIDFLLRVFEGGAEVGKVAEILYEWRQHPQQTTRRSPRHLQRALRHCKARYFLRGPGRERPIDLVSTGETLRSWHELLQREGARDVVPVEWRSGVALPRRRPDAVRLFVFGMAKARAAAEKHAADFDPRHDWFAG